MYNYYQFLASILIFLMPYIINGFDRFPDYGYDNIPRTWEPVNFRGGPHGVEERVNDFLYDNNVTNCYEHQEDINHLLLKCWSNEDLVDVSILIRRNNLLPVLYEKPTTNIAVC